MGVECVRYCVCPFYYAGLSHSELEPNLIFKGETPHLYENGDMTNASSFKRAESIYFLEKFEQPIHLLLHKPEWDRTGTATWADGSLQTTALYQPFRQPVFVNPMLPDMLGLIHPQGPNKTLPAVNAAWINHEEQSYPLIQLFHQFETEQIYPEYIWGHHGAIDRCLQSWPFGEHHYFELAIQKFYKWYDIVDTFHGQNLVMREAQFSSNPPVYLLKLKDEFRPRMIRAGYSYDPTGFNRASMGSLTDLNRAILGYDSPMRD